MSTRRFLNKTDSVYEAKIFLLPTYISHTNFPLVIWKTGSNAEPEEVACGSNTACRERFCSCRAHFCSWSSSCCLAWFWTWIESCCNCAYLDDSTGDCRIACSSMSCKLLASCAWSTRIVLFSSWACDSKPFRAVSIPSRAKLIKCYTRTYPRQQVQVYL